MTQTDLFEGRAAHLLPVVQRHHLGRPAPGWDVGVGGESTRWVVCVCVFESHVTYLAWQSAWMRLAMNSELPVADP